ncbi:hypothetical protein [Mesorhizobium marinum]|uniref:DUF2946 domain-containing protein n=1 Tax=Mesorhizobium marinum TaxID=3228790 RepID=A0ABV3R1E0_9HYPH
MNATKQQRRLPLALVAAAVLVLNALLSPWAYAAPQGTLVDAFGNPLCITSADGHAPSPARDHSSFPDCCTLGCAGAAHALAAPPGAGDALAHPLLPRAVAASASEPIVLKPAGHNPGSPRAPPRSI